MALLLTRPDLARAHLLRAASPAVRRRRRAALVARTGRTRPPQPVLGRPAVAAVRRWPSTCASTGDTAVLEERVTFLTGAAPARGRAGGLRPAGDRGRGRHALRALPAGHRPRDHGRIARAAAHRRQRLERRHEPRRSPRAGAKACGSASSCTSSCPTSRDLCDARHEVARASRYRDEADAPGRPPRTEPGTANGIAAAITTTARRSDRHRTTSAGSTRSPSRGRCCRGPCRSATPNGPWTPCAPRWWRGAPSCCCCSSRPSTSRRRSRATSRATRPASARTAASTRMPPPGS